MNTKIPKQNPGRVKRLNQNLRPLKEVIQPRDKGPQTLARLRKNWKEADRPLMEEDSLMLRSFVRGTYAYFIVSKCDPSS